MFTAKVYKCKYKMGEVEADVMDPWHATKKTEEEFRGSEGVLCQLPSNCAKSATNSYNTPLARGVLINHNGHIGAD